MREIEIHEILISCDACDLLCEHAEIARGELRPLGPSYPHGRTLFTLALYLYCMYCARPFPTVSVCVWRVGL